MNKQKHAEIKTLFSPEGDIDFQENKNEAKEWIDKNYHKQIVDDFTEQEKQILVKYTEGFYKLINSYLRDAEGDISKEGENIPPGYSRRVVKNTIDKIEIMDRAFAKMQTMAPLFLYRRTDQNQFGKEFAGSLRSGMSINQEVANQIIQKLSQGIHTEYGYVSTSLIKDATPTFDERNNPILLKIHVPKKTNVLFLEHLTTNEDELEVLLKRGSRFTYDHFSIINEKSGQTLKIEATLIPN